MGCARAGYEDSGAQSDRRDDGKRTAEGLSNEVTTSHEGPPGGVHERSKIVWAASPCVQIKGSVNDHEPVGGATPSPPSLAL
ncbi:MAG: hypothetical protein NVS4B3_23560 [Gemmatimonadaceae bacterium]